MKGLWAVHLAFLTLLLFPACTKERERMDNFMMEFATVEKENSNYRFRLDNGRLLVPEEEKNYSGEVGQRVVINYVPLEGNTIKINNISNIFTGTIQNGGYPNNYSDDPLKIQSVWVGGNYLNLILETEYHSKPHSVALLLDPSSTTIDLYFSHSTNDDPPGYPKKLYASFLISDLRKLTEESPVPFRLFINTFTEMRMFDLELSKLSNQ